MKLFPNVDYQRKFLLTPTRSKTELPPEAQLPRPCTMLQAVKTYFDIQSIPRFGLLVLLLLSSLYTLDTIFILMWKPRTAITNNPKK